MGYPAKLGCRDPRSNDLVTTHRNGPLFHISFYRFTRVDPLLPAAKQVALYLVAADGNLAIELCAEKAILIYI